MFEIIIGIVLVSMLFSFYLSHQEEVDEKTRKIKSIFDKENRQD